MNWLIIFLAVFMGFFFLFIPAFGLFFWWVSFNRRAIILKEVGDDANDAILKHVRCKVVTHPSIGEVIKFLPFSGYPTCKKFGSKHWISIKHKNKLVEGIILYCQGNNFRPVTLHQLAERYVLKVKDEDNRRFLMQYEIMKNNTAEDYNMLRYGVIGFFGSITVIGVIMLFVILFIMDEGTKQYFLYKGAELIVK